MPRRNKFVCLNCEQEVIRSNATKYCSSKCQQKYIRKEFIKKWKLGTIPPEKCYNGPNNAISNHIRSYLFEKNSHRCENCGWNELNESTMKIPLQVDHIDGDSKNCKEQNLRLLCPNCHSLTPTFGSLNKGNGRKNRRNADVAQW
jgi:Zn finger protein HypA/HybF involved in hydrogenase expression